MTDEALQLEVMGLIIAFANKDFSRRLPVGSGDSVLDGIVAGLNMLGEEMQRGERVDDEYRRRAVRAERLASVGQLAASVAHEINNPAAFLSTNSVSLTQKLEAARAALAPAPASAEVDHLLREALEIVAENQTGIKRIVDIVADLRRRTRIQDEPRELLAIDRVVAEACRMVGHQVRYRAALVTSLQASQPVMASAGQLCQVVCNLLVNAAQSLPEGNAESHRVTVQTSSSTTEVTLRVTDTGTGIDAETQRRVFEPFFTTKGEAEGTGLGLFVCSQIVAELGGTIRCDSTPGNGATFEVRLPVAAAPRAPAPAPVPAASGGRMKLLIIDDESNLLRAYQRTLGRHHDLTVAHGGLAAVDIIAQDPRWDLIICDVMMPDLDGRGVQEWIAQHQPQLASRLVFSSGGVFTERTTAFLASMGERVLDKPVTLAALEAYRSRS